MDVYICTNDREVMQMIECVNCVHTNVCGKKGQAVSIVKDLGLNEAIQTMKNKGFSFEVACMDFSQGQGKILGGNYEQ